MKKITLVIIGLVFSLVSSYAGEYQLVLGRFTWSEAKVNAAAKGGHLAIVDSASKQSQLEALVKDEKIKGAKAFYIGATDEDVEGVWKWVNGSAVEYDNWTVGAPSGGNVGISGADYATFTTGGWGNEPSGPIKFGDWNDDHDLQFYYSRQLSGYILEIEGTPLPPNKDKKVLYNVIKPVPPGFSLMSIPFSNKDNRISTIFGDMNDVTVYDYNYEEGWVVNSYDKEFQEWDIPNHVLEGGSAIWILNQSPSVQYIRLKGNIPTAWRAAPVSPTLP